MPSYYTRDGDDGYTGLLGEGRIPKYHPRAEALGTLDEVSAVLGLARAQCITSQSVQAILLVQHDIYQAMTEISATPENAIKFRMISSENILTLEEIIDKISLMVSPPTDFILPGDSPSGAIMDFARTIIRRAERRVSGLYHSGEISNPAILQYLNRLSSLCFILELLENQAAGSETPTLAKLK